MKKVIENKKVLLGVITLLLVLAIIVVSSFWPFILEPSKIMTTKFLTDELFITTIVLSTTIAMMFLSQASNANNSNSELAKAKVEFKKSLEKITDHTKLFQWIKNVLQPHDKQEMAEREMAKLLLPHEIYDLTETELLSLQKAQKFGDKFYGPYSLDKIKKVILLKKKINKVKFVSANYYTSVKSIQSNKTLSELANSENLKKILTVVIQLTVKIMMTWMFASILGSLVRDLTQEGGSNAQTWMTFLSRGFAFGTSCFLGYNVGCRLNDLDAFYINKRIEVHTMFLEDVKFEKIDESKEAFKQRVREENTLLLEQVV